MNRSELIEHLSQKSGFSLQKTEMMVELITRRMAKALEEGQRIEIRGFGSFDLSYRPARQARNPKTGETFAMGGKYFPAFRAGKLLKANSIKQA